MGAYGSLSAKRHVGWSNDKHFLEQLVREGGFLSSAERSLLGPSPSTNRRWDDRVGKYKYSGCKTALRDSQYLTGTWNFLFLFWGLFIEFSHDKRGCSTIYENTEVAWQEISGSIWAQDCGSLSFSQRGTCAKSMPFHYLLRLLNFRRAHW